MTKIENFKTPVNNYIIPKREEVKKDKPHSHTKKNSRMLQTTLMGAGIAGLAIVEIYQRNKINRLLQNQNKCADADSLLPYKIVDFTKTKLYSAFEKSKTGFISFLSSLNSEPSKVKEFLFAITADKKISVDFINEVISDPRKSSYNLKILKEKIGGENNLIEWLQAPKGYNEAYDRYIIKIAHEALDKSDTDTLLRISPNWHVHILRNGKENFHIGKLPETFEKLYDFNHFIEWLKSHDYKIGEPKTLEYSGIHMEVTSLSNGKSCKTPYKIKFLNGNDKKEYVIKIQQKWGCHSNYAKECLAYRSDSTFTNAQIDYYLTLNNCENSPKMYYYDYGSNISIYEFQAGNHPHGLNNQFAANQKLTDLNRLGIYYNDASDSNFIEQDGVLKVVDIGDSSFIDPLRPGGKGFNFQLPNWCGAGLPNLSMLLTK